MCEEDVEHWHHNNTQLKSELWRIRWWRKVWTRLMRQETCPLLRCRKHYVNQFFGNSMIKFELSCHVRNTLYLNEKKNEKSVFQNYFLRLIKGPKVFLMVWKESQSTVKIWVMNPKLSICCFSNNFLSNLTQDLLGIKGYNIVFQVVFQHISPA